MNLLELDRILEQQFAERTLDILRKINEVKKNLKKVREGSIEDVTKSNTIWTSDEQLTVMYKRTP